jgi:hypothetical protein
VDYTEYAKYCRLIGYRVEETPHGIWIGISRGFFNRVPPYETALPTKEELHSLFRRYPIVGVHYSVEPGSQGKAGYVYFVCDQDYDLKNLDSKGRWSVRKGLRNCQVRPMSFDELHRLGMSLNLDTLARQRRDDPMFRNPDRWMRFCQGGEQVEGAQVWGAFVAGELAAYIVFFQLGEMVNCMYQMSCTRLMKLHSNPALTFTVTQTMMRSPGVKAVCYGPGGPSEGLDEYKERMGFNRQPVVFVVRLRPVVKRALLNWGGRQAIAALGRWLPDRDLYRRVQAVLDIAAMSSGSFSDGTASCPSG